MGVDLGGLEIGMSEPFADLVERYAMLGKAGCERMPKVVPSHTATFSELRFLQDMP